MQSYIKELGNVKFPQFQSERLYQIPFYQGKALPAEISRWQETVDAMTDGLTIEEEMYLMVDQKFVTAGETHRRAGMHIDGHWDPTLHSHGGGGHRGGIQAGWNDDGGDNRWKHWNFTKDTGGLLLASDVVACRAMVGEFDDVIPAMGDCSHVDTSHMSEAIMSENKTYFANITCLHESMPLVEDSVRTLVRITLPENYKMH